MGRLTAYMFVASIGFVVGVLIYIIGVLVLPWIIESFPAIAAIIAANRQIIEALISGFIGSILAVAIAYIWASRGESY